jgi:hypothetical protein
MRPAFLTAFTLFALACCIPVANPRPYQEPRADELIAHIKGEQKRAASFRAESTMDYWLDDQRLRGTVLLLGEWGSKLRFNAENPTGGSVAADLACDGKRFNFVDSNKNCQLSGRCDSSAIQTFFRVTLAPDDFIAMAIGSTPLLETDDRQIDWDGNKRVERLELRRGSRRQIVELDGKDKRWDVVSSTLYDGDAVLWSLENKDFREWKTEGGDTLRAPKRTRFKQPKEEADLVIRWRERAFNIKPGPEQFSLTPPAGLPSCQ